MHTQWVRFVLALVVLISFSISAHAAELDEYSVFISGFTAFQNQDYQGAATKMAQFLKEYPATPLRDMALFWLARAQFRLGDRQQAARNMAQFLKENPDTPLRSAVEPELLSLAGNYPQGEPLVIAGIPRSDATTAGAVPVVAPASVAAVPAKQSAPPADPQVAPVPRADKSLSAIPTPDMRARAISEYRAVMEKFPGTPAAATAASRLRDVPQTTSAAAVAAPRTGSSMGVVTLEVGQYAAAEFTMAVPNEKSEAGSLVSIPFQVINRGNGPDQFSFESGFPADFKARVVTAADSHAALVETPLLAPGEPFSGIVQIQVPASLVDGQRGAYPMRFISKLDRDISASKEVSLGFSAPLLRMVAKPDKADIIPGETVSYRFSLLNLGSASAQRVSFAVNYPPHYEPVEPLPTGFRRIGPASLSSDMLAVASGGRQEFTISFRLKDEALAGQELFCRLELQNHALHLAETFLSPVAVVGKMSGVLVRSQSEERTVLPGERVVIPISLINTGNIREKFLVTSTVPPGIRYTLYRSGGSGGRQVDEPVADSIGVLSPREEAALKMELIAPAVVNAATESRVVVMFEPDQARGSAASVVVRLVVVRPVVSLEMETRGGRLKPGEIAHMVISAVNSGLSMAKDVEVSCGFPEHLELVAADPAAADGQAGRRSWKIPQLGPGERRNIILAYRIKPGIAAGTSLRIENQVTYRDQLGTVY
jgi:uncharacterized membrane protein